MVRFVGGGGVGVFFDRGKNVETGRTKSAGKSAAAGEQIDGRETALRALPNTAVTRARVLLTHAPTASSSIRPSSPTSRRRTSNFSRASGEGTPLPFSHRLIVDQLTPTRLARCS